MSYYDECHGQHAACDVCDGMRNDPHTGWGGFADHYAKKHFSSTEERDTYYEDKRKNGESPERETWEDDD